MSHPLAWRCETLDPAVAGQPRVHFNAGLDSLPFACQACLGEDEPPEGALDLASLFAAGVDSDFDSDFDSDLDSDLDPGFDSVPLPFFDGSELPDFL